MNLDGSEGLVASEDLLCSGDEKIQDPLTEEGAEAQQEQFVVQFLWDYYINRDDWGQCSGAFKEATGDFFCTGIITVAFKQSARQPGSDRC